METTHKPAPDWEKIEADYRAGILSLREIAEAHPGTNHVAIARKAKREGWSRADRAADRDAPKLTDEDDGRAGFLYVIYLDDSAGERFFKIGMAGSFTSRHGAHQCASPFEIRVACAYYVGNMRAEERFLHAKFSENRVRGEWFRLSQHDLSMIAERSKLI